MCACVGMCIGECVGPCLDEVRQMLTDMCIRAEQVFVRTTTWDGGEPGLGNKVVVDLPIVPNPLVVRNSGPTEMDGLPGRRATGIVKVEDISATFTRDQLTGEPIPVGTDVTWVIHANGWEETYRLLTEPAGDYLGWTVSLTRMAEVAKKL